MGILSREALWEQMKRAEMARVYVLFGPETYLRDIAAKKIADALFAEGDFRDLNENCFSLNDQKNLEKALAVARQLPMMATRRVVTITDVRISATGFRDTVVEDNEPMLAEYFADPSPTATVVFIADDLNGNRKMGKFLKTNASAIEFARMSDDQLPAFASKEFEKAGAEIDGLTLREFVSRIGPDLRRMTNEIKKLATAALPSTRVTTELIEELIPIVREVDHFSLTDSIVAGRKDTAIRLLRKALDDGAEPLMLLGLLGYNYRRLLMAKDMMERGVERREVERVLNLRYPKQESFLAAARRVEMKKLVTAVKRLAQTDVAIKTSIGGSGPAGAQMQIEMLVCELALL